MSKILTNILALALVIGLTLGKPSEVGQTCSSDSDCNPPFDTCNMQVGECQHKEVFPLELIEYFGSLLLGFLIAMCNAGGIGGGEIIVPIILIFFSFTTKQAIALSNCWIFAGSITRFILNYKQTHPTKDALSIDYSIVMVMLPMVLLGSTIGVQANSVLPELVLLIGMTALIAFIAVKSIFNAIKVRRKEVASRVEDLSPAVSCSVSSSKDKSSRRDENELEGGKDEESENEGGEKVGEIWDESKQNDENKYFHNADIEEQSTPDAGPSNLNNTNLKFVKVDSFKSATSKSSMEKNTSTGSSKHMERIVMNEKRHCKPSSLLMIPFLFMVVILLSLLRGTSSQDSIVGVELWSAGYFSLYVVLILFCIIMTVINIIIVKREYRLKKENGYEFAEGDLKWETNLLVKFLMWAFGAGVVAGTVGLGGGVIFNPLMLSFGVPPIVASATGMYIVMFSTLSSSILYSLAGLLDYEYGLFLWAYIVTGALIGLIVVNQYIKRTGKQSILAFLLAGVIALAAIVIPVYSLVSVIQDPSKLAFEFSSMW